MLHIPYTETNRQTLTNTLEAEYNLSFFGGSLVAREMEHTGRATSGNVSDRAAA